MELAGEISLINCLYNISKTWADKAKVKLFVQESGVGSISHKYNIIIFKYQDFNISFVI